MAAPASKIEVRLSADQRAALERLVHTGTHPAHARRRAAILLKADADGPDAWPDDRIAEKLDINRNTVWRTRARFAAEGLDATLHKKKATGRQYRKLDGEQEAKLVTLACSAPPEGQGRWTLKLLSERLVELEVVEAIDPSTVWRTLQKTRPSRG
jgi:transposase